MADPPADMRARVDVLTGYAEEAAGRGEHLFYIRIPASIQPLERGERFEDPLQQALEAASIGEVAGGGSQLGDDDTIVYCGIDVIVRNRDEGLRLIRRSMRESGAPPGTVIEEFVPEWAELQV
jgi:hypothetical protein